MSFRLPKSKRRNLGVHLDSTQNLVQLHLNRTFDQLSPPTPPAIVSRERRAAPASPPSSRATPPTTVPIPRALPTPAIVQSGSVPSVPHWQTVSFTWHGARFPRSGLFHLYALCALCALRAGACPDPVGVANPVLSSFTEGARFAQFWCTYNYL